MLRLRSLTFQGLILSCRSFTRWSVKFLSSKLCAEFCWFLCSCIFNNYVEKSKFWNRKINKSENILRCIYFKIISVNLFKDLVCTNKLEVFFFLKIVFFQRLGVFLMNAEPLIWASFFAQVNYSYIFFQVWSFHFNIIFVLCCKHLFRKIEKKNGDFTLLNKSLEPYKLL